ncbi:MAG: hypothetical protein OEZ34_03450, partial [Spirochaetia bacterium]|nr:hypothetical protein [Spirochaetia bacterium]
AYGNGLEGCRSQRLYVPVGTGNRNKISETIMKMKPSGSTPIEETLNLIEKKILPSKKDAVIILISDGVESCGGNPGAVAAKIGKKYPKVKIHVIGLSVEKPDARELGDLAKKGKGLFFDVKTSKDFNLALNESLGHQLKSKEVQKKIVTSDSNSAPLLRLKKIEVSDLSSESVKIKVFYETRGISIGNYVLNISAVTPVPFNPWETLVDPGVKQIVFQPVSRYGIGSENSVLEVEFPLKELDNVPILVQGELWKTTKIPNLLDISNRLPLKFR